MTVLITSDSRVSSVPDREFDRPSTANELFDLATAGIRILFAASGHIVDKDFEAFQVVCSLHRQICEAYDWMFAAKWIGLAKWQKTGAA